MAFGTRPESVYAITKAVRAHCKKPLMVKLSPNVADIAEVAKAAEEGGADAISLINTLPPAWRWTSARAVPCSKTWSAACPARRCAL